MRFYFNLYCVVYCKVVAKSLLVAIIRSLKNRSIIKLVVLDYLADLFKNTITVILQILKQSGYGFARKSFFF